MKFDQTEIATLLAALQLYRESGYGNPKMDRWISQRILGIATWSFRVPRMHDKGIERLMSRIKESGDQSLFDVPQSEESS